MSHNESIRIYFAQACKTPLLSRDKEVVLAKIVKRGEEAKKKLKEEKTAAKKRKTAKRLKKIIARGNIAAKIFAQANLRLVISIAKRYQGRVSNLTLIELIGEGNFGLLKAVKKFDWSRGFKFSSYATWAIRRAIEEAISCEKSMLSLISLDNSTDDDKSLYDILFDTKETLENMEVRISVLRKRLKKLLSSLHPTDRKILSMIFESGYSLRKIGKIIGLTAERIRQRKNKALKLLRRRCNPREFD